MYRVKAHVGVDCDGIGLVALERFDGVLLGGGANVTALGIENHGNLRMFVFGVADDVFEYAFRAMRGEVGDLRFEGTHIRRSGVDNSHAKFVKRLLNGLVTQMCR